MPIDTFRKSSFGIILLATMAGMLLCPAGSAFASSGELVVNEFMADNETTATDPAGEYDDWIELYNGTDAAISLAGCHLTDDPDDLAQWAFPDVSIAAGAYLIVWADDDEGQEGMHANFKLSASGEAIVLSNAALEIVDQVTFGSQETDVSMARFPNGTGNFMAMAPTFGTENTVSGVIPGDVDGNGGVELADGVLALQVVAGITTDAAPHREAGLGSRGVIGLPEALYVMQQVALVEEEEESGALITLLGNSITVEGFGAIARGSVVTITAGGVYTLTGTLADGQVIVDTDDEKRVGLVFSGVDIASASSAPVFIASAKAVTLTLAAGTQNHLTDPAAYVYDDPEEDEPDAALFSEDDLTIQGSGTLTVHANYADGVKCKDGLVIAGGTLVVYAADDGILGKDHLIVQGGNITVNAGGDGLKSTSEDAGLGYILLQGGVYNITSGSDGIQAESVVTVTAGTYTINAGGGNNAVIGGDDSAKGIKGAAGVVIDNGIFTLDCADDGVHSDGSITINGGTFSIATGDDGIHADLSIGINGGDIVISKSYEGIESQVIVINDGNIHVTSSDDGINVAGGEAFSAEYQLHINGGYIVVNAVGDGIDVNGVIEMSGGTVLVNGPAIGFNAALDYDISFTITGGFLVAAGSSQMAQAPGATSTQYSVQVDFHNTVAANTLVHVQTTSGAAVFTFAPAKGYQSVVFSMSALTYGASYEVYRGGSSTGTTVDGLCQGGVYTPGSLYRDFTISSLVTKVM